MALPSSGAISLYAVNIELGLSGTTTISLNQSTVRDLFGVASGQISMSDGYGKTSATFQFLSQPGAGNSSTTDRTSYCCQGGAAGHPSGDGTEGSVELTYQFQVAEAGNYTVKLYGCTSNILTPELYSVTTSFTAGEIRTYTYTIAAPLTSSILLKVTNTSNLSYILSGVTTIECNACAIHDYCSTTNNGVDNGSWGSPCTFNSGIPYPYGTGACHGCCDACCTGCCDENGENCTCDCTCGNCICGPCDCINLNTGDPAPYMCEYGTRWHDVTLKSGGANNFGVVPCG